MRKSIILLQFSSTQIVVKKSLKSISTNVQNCYLKLMNFTKYDLIVNTLQRCKYNFLKRNLKNKRENQIIL